MIIICYIYNHLYLHVFTRIYNQSFIIMSVQSIIDISNIKNFISDKSFIELKTENDNDKNNNIEIKTPKENEKTPDLSNLYLLVSKDDDQFNGIIFEKDTNKIVCANQNKVIDMQDTIKLKNTIDNAKGLIRYEYCEDGTIIRLYNYKDNWYTATTKCINANDSYWSSEKSFNELFWEVFDKDLLSTLDKSYTYIFVLLHSENRIVIRHTKNMLVYVVRINNETLEEDYNNQFKGIYGIKRPNVIVNMDINNINNYLHPFKRGILVKIYNANDKKWVIYKHDFENYIFIKDVRGNVPQIRYRYLELLNNPDNIKHLEFYYNENYVMFTIIKSGLKELVHNIYKLYVESHIKHSVRIEEDNLFYTTLRQLHAQYKKNNKPITYNDVADKIYSMDKPVLKKLLKWV